MIIDVRNNPDSLEVAKYGFGTHKVLVDGLECKDVFFVDTEAGIVDSYRKDEHDKYMLVDHGEVATEIRKGKVELVPLQ